MLRRSVAALAVSGTRGAMAGARASSGSACAAVRLRVASWNLAAINNNPFEYWVTHDDPAYNELMANVQDFINSPGDKDVPVSEVFDDGKFEELAELMRQHGWEGVDATAELWRSEYRDRRIVSEFMKDAEIGTKRLASMPDRVTNTVNLADGSQAHRPTPINCYSEDFASFDDWWARWKAFMFEDAMQVKSKQEVKEVKGVDLLVPIKRAKYPALSEQEEAISLPLQTLCGAIFDGILVHMLNSLAPGKWQQLRHELANALNRNKNEQTLRILANKYADMDIVFLQEVANAFVGKLEGNADLSARYVAIVPETSGKRDQNSVILVRKSLIKEESVKDVTGLVNERFEGKSVPVAEGDIVAATVELADSEQTLLLASFHGDTNGLATIPVVDAVHDVAQNSLTGKELLVFGLDANTYEKSKPGKNQGVVEFGEHYVSKGLTSCWGDKPSPTEYTTYNARTYLQPQLNKAASKSEFLSKGDVNPKDFILFYPDQFEAEGGVVKDNTGDKAYLEDTAFPTLSFPSDHAIISTELAARL